MPLIEELPINTTVRASHGWAYVPDTGPIAAVQPGTRDRKRPAGNPKGPSASAKQQKAIQQRLESLDKENYKDGVSIPIPARQVGRENKTSKKTSTNVKRILMYQRTFAHYLADEETNAAIAAAIAAVPVASNISTTAMAPPSTPASQRTEQTAGSRRKSALNIEKTHATTTPSEPKRRGRPPKRGSLRSSTGQTPLESTPTTKVEDEVEDTAMTDAPASIETEAESTQEKGPQETTVQTSAPPQAESYDASWDADPMLVSRDVPRMPSERVMQLLLAEPPLSYAAARAKPLDEDRQMPKRNFCSTCGYWGRVRCKKCEDWTCGLMECWKGHEGVCIMANAY